MTFARGSSGRYFFSEWKYRRNSPSYQHTLCDFCIYVWGRVQSSSWKCSLQTTVCLDMSKRERSSRMMVRSTFCGEFQNKDRNESSTVSLVWWLSSVCTHYKTSIMTRHSDLKHELVRARRITRQAIETTGWTCGKYHTDIQLLEGAGSRIPWLPFCKPRYVTRK